MQQTLLQLLLVVMVQSLTYINEVGIGKFCTLEYSASGKYLPKNLRLENRWHLKSGFFLASNQ